MEMRIHCMMTDYLEDDKATKTQNTRLHEAAEVSSFPEIHCGKNVS